MVPGDWRQFVTHGHTDRHVALFYERDEFVHRCVAVWAATSLAMGGGAILVGTPAKLVGIRVELRRLGVDVDAREASGRLLAVDAESLLSQFTAKDGLDRAAFSRLIAQTAARVRTSCGSTRAEVRAWGEMVNLLCARDEPATAARLESLWEEALERHDIQLLCSYRFAGAADVVSGRCAPHTQILLESTPMGLEVAVSQALAKSFKSQSPQDPRLLYIARHAVKVDGEESAVLVALKARTDPSYAAPSR